MKDQAYSSLQRKAWAEVIGRFGEMAIFSNAAKKLVNSYYKNYI